jgi:hypothetical protein
MKTQRLQAVLDNSLRVSGSERLITTDNSNLLIFLGSFAYSYLVVVIGE